MLSEVQESVVQRVADFLQGFSVLERFAEFFVLCFWDIGVIFHDFIKGVHLVGDVFAGEVFAVGAVRELFISNTKEHPAFTSGGLIDKIAAFAGCDIIG